jgi:AcrR family transcriptional regulator
VTERERRKTETRERILASASRLFRRDGYAATGVDAVMTGAGLTAGGFYAHFASKDALLRECLSRAFDESWKRLSGGLEGTPKQKRAKLLERYLSPLHRDHPAEGCPLAGIAAELGRNPKLTAELTEQYVQRLIDELERLGLTRKRAIPIISRALGALMLSRSVQSRAFSDEILSACSKQL